MLIKLDGYLDTEGQDVDLDFVIDSFIAWVEYNNWTYGGGISEVQEQVDNNK